MKKKGIEQKKSLKKGFTLIEVILVVAIIAVISTIAVPQVGKYLNKANRSRIIGAISELNNSSTSWSIDHGGDSPKNLQEILTEHGNLEKLGIGMTATGNFKVGNIKGVIIYDKGEIYGKVDSDSKAFPGEEIRK